MFGKAFLKLKHAINVFVFCDIDFLCLISAFDGIENTILLALT